MVTRLTLCANPKAISCPFRPWILLKQAGASIGGPTPASRNHGKQDGLFRGYEVSACPLSGASLVSHCGRNLVNNAVPAIVFNSRVRRRGYKELSAGIRNSLYRGRS